MPYIRAPKAEPWTPRKPLEDGGQIGPGDLNWSVHQRVAEYLRVNGGLSYRTINDVVGVLECVKMELYRRLAAPYEDAKKVQNGDVKPYTEYPG